MTKLLSILMLLISTLPLHAQSSKRGLAYGHHSANDLEVLSPNVMWWYNWSETPESEVSNVFEEYGFDFVPMTWNGNYNETKLRNFLKQYPETKYLLAFNEPNFIDQAKMTPSEVAAQWPGLEAIADEFNLKIVGPAVNYCGSCVSENGTTYTDPFQYLDDFFAACPGCRVDYIAAHSYMNTVSALQWYIGEFKRYNKPLWLTEFAGWEYNGNISTANDQINFMIGAVDLLEADQDVFRYAWFIGRGDGIDKFPYIDILGADGELTELGKVYTQMPTHHPNQIQQLPNQIEAENYNRMNGIQLERTKDESGFLDVGYFDTGDWLEYKIKVPDSQLYQISFRVASTQNAKSNVLIDGEVALMQEFSNTNGWQNWQTFTNTINLTKGVHILKFQAASSGFNLNWINIKQGTSGKTFKLKDQHRFAFPNPCTGTLNLIIEPNYSKIKLMNRTGEVILNQEFQNTLRTEKLNPGIYYIQAIDKRGNIAASQKIVISKNNY